VIPRSQKRKKDLWSDVESFYWRRAMILGDMIGAAVVQATVVAMVGLEVMAK